MADDQDNPPPKPGRRKGNPFRVVKSTTALQPSDAQVRQLYMASAFVEWTPFARSMGWDPSNSRSNRPVGDWIEEKRATIAREQAEHIADAVFNHRSRWHQDVLKTLKEYPEANDAMLGILKKRLNDIIEVINLDGQERTLAAQRGEKYAPQFANIKSSELMTLAAAIKVTTESKHRSLMINDWSFKVAETFSDPKQFGDEAARVADQEWKVEIIGGENLTSREMQKFLAQWYDAPVARAQPAEE